MTKPSKSVDKTRASRDGHEYHEAWTARKAMQLLLPGNKLVGIAVEGLHPEDQVSASADTVDIADITLYYGRRPTFRQSEKIIFAQFKYSISKRNVDFRASDAKKTISKYATTYRDLTSQHGTKAVQEKLEFELITNRPIYKPLLQAIDAIAENLSRSGEIKKQADQFRKASGLKGEQLAKFANKFKLIGLTGSLPTTKSALSTLLVDWSSANDALAHARLGAQRQMVRDKAGYAGTNKNVIERTDVLAALQIGQLDDLLPCPSALAQIGNVIEREQLTEAIALITKLSKPLLIHSSGGVGKTVFMDSLASSIKDQYETVFFDCFGGGAYRAPEDSRHLPKYGLVHIANTLAFRGMCDPILPDSGDATSLVRTFRRRLTQCVETLSRISADRELVLFIDAIDNAEMQASDSSEPSFPNLLLESINLNPLSGVKLIVSCRTHRRPDNHSDYEELELQPFSLGETEVYFKFHLPKFSQVELNVAQARSGGNPRVLEYLLSSGRGLLDKSEINNKIELNELIQKRISEALSEARKYGYRKKEIGTFLSGLGTLPSPVPLDEYANALGMEMSAMESFVSDLWPLLERTNQGVMFRDEPTETLVRDNYSSSITSLRLVAKNLLAQQGASVYAARALPGLLQKLGDGAKLFKLAFDGRIPSAITSTVGKRNIRYARLKAASLHAATKRDHNKLVQLLVELSTIAAVDQRGADYILEYPDLVVTAQDADAIRRLFETRTSWPGARHARLVIANVLSGDSEEATRHAVMANDWIRHHKSMNNNKSRYESGPEHLDIAAIPFFLISQGRPKEAANALRGWKDWYKYELCEQIFGLSQLAHSRQSQSTCYLKDFINAMTGDIGILTASLSFQNLSRHHRKDLITNLAKACRKTKSFGFKHMYRRDMTNEFSNGLRKASALALSMNLGADALAISLRAPHDRPSIWSFRDNLYSHDVFPFVFRTAIVSAVKKTTLHEKVVLPKELAPICSRINKNLTGDDFRRKAKEILPKYVQRKRLQDHTDKDKAKISYEAQQAAELFLDQQMEPLLALTKSLKKFLVASTRNVNQAFAEILETWKEARKSNDPYTTQRFSRFFQRLGLEIALFAIWVRSDLKLSSVQSFLKCLHEQEMVSEYTIIQIVSIMAKRQDFQTIAGEQAQKASLLIEQESDITLRASLYAQLARAILPASTDEATVYFRSGLDQMATIGSGDYHFTNELLLFASSIKGKELDERDFHTLTNICELNLGEEPEKFPWGAFARGLSKVAGPRGLAKLSRWDDRSIISLSHTLLPYLTALVGNGKIEAEDALALNRLADPVEFFDFGTEAFAQAIHKNAGRNEPKLIEELIRQFVEDNPGVLMGNTVKALASQAEEVLGISSETTDYLSVAHKRFAEVSEILNKHMNHSGWSDTWNSKQVDDLDRENKKNFKQILAKTKPTDEASLEAAIAAINELKSVFELKREFFAALRDKVVFKDRAKYIRLISKLKDYDLYGKLAELCACKENWGQSSASLGVVYRNLAIPLIQLHADDLVRDDQLSGYQIKEISDLTAVPISDLILELIKSFARPNTFVSGAVWLALGSFICHEAAEGQGQVALKRLLGSDAAKLSTSVIDGEWEDGLYPQGDVQEIAAGLVWRMLGSPDAVDRWRAAHSVRCFAKFGRWHIIDSLVTNLELENAGPLQAKELPFFFMHSQLWLLISLARIALNHPEQVARYKTALLRIAMEVAEPHVLMQHFAAHALLTCIDSDTIKVRAKVEEQLRNIDLSPHSHETWEGAGIFGKRPNTVPKPGFIFDLDIDFKNDDLEDLCRLFEKPIWEVEDMISTIVRRIDHGTTSMYESGGRDIPHMGYRIGMNDRYHTHGQQLGWHALFLVAGRLLRECPVKNDLYNENDPWEEWLSRYLLTRDDGLWLSDGIDRTPLDVVEILLEKKKETLVLTGDKNKILNLAGITPSIGKKLVVSGDWHSADNVKVMITSSLVPPFKASQLARELAREEPKVTWLPSYGVYANEPEHINNEKRDFTPWIVYPAGEAKLDEHDCFVASSANLRHRVAADFLSGLGWTKGDPFGRVWMNKRGHMATHAQAWGLKNKYTDEELSSGLRLLCTGTTLKTILTKNNKDLLLLIKLQRYEEKSFRTGSRFTHTMAVVHINKELKWEYFKGPISHFHP